MKRAILIGFVAMAPVAGCGSDGTRGGRRVTAADPLGAQPPPGDPNSPPSDPNNPPSDPNAPPSDPNAPPSDPNAPPVANTNRAGAPALNCPTLCGNIGSCQTTCAQVCTGIGSVTGTCLPPLNTFLACAGGITFSCNGRGDNVSINLANPCVDQARAVLQCLGIDISIRVPQSTDTAGDRSGNGPPPGQ